MASIRHVKEHTMNILTPHSSVPLKEAAVTGSAIYKNQLYLGHQDGHLDIYDITREVDSSPHKANGEILTPKAHLKLVDGPIESLQVLPDMGYLIILSNGLVYIFTMPEYQLEEKLSNFKNTTVVKVYSSMETSDYSEEHVFDSSFIEKNSLLDYSDSMSLATASSANPFDVSGQHRQKFDTAKVMDYRSYIALCYKRKLVVYSFIKDEFNSKLEYALNDKVKCLEFLSSEKLAIMLNSNDLVLVDLYTSDPTTAIMALDSLPFISNSVVSSSSTFSYFRNNSSKSFIVRTLPHVNVVSKETVAIKIGDSGEFLSYKKRSPKKNPLFWSKPPEAVIFWFPYLILQNDGHVIEIRKIRTGELQQSITLKNHIKQIVHTDSLLFAISDTKVEVLVRETFKNLLSQARSSSRYEDAISLIEKLKPSVCQAEFDDFFGESNGDVVGITEQDKKFLLLRDFEIKFAKELFEKGEIDRAIDLFTSFMAPPNVVFELFPDLEKDDLIFDTIAEELEETNSLSSPTKKTSSLGFGSPTKELRSPSSAKHGNNTHHHHHHQGPRSVRNIVSLIPYLTDTRRKLNKMLNPESPKFEWNGVTISKKLYMSSNSADDESLLTLIKSVDTMLFKSYMITSPRLVGPLLRVNNYCDIETVERLLRKHSMYKELIDFYYTKKLHDKALELLKQLGSQNEQQLHGPLPTIQYLQKLDDANLQLVFQYLQWPMSIDLDLCKDIFLNDSIESESLNRFRVLSFLESHVGHRADIIKAYLEYLIFDLNDETTKLHNRLVEVYIQLGEISSLESLLQNSDAYDYHKAISMIDEAHLDEFLFAKTIVLSKLKEHGQILDIFIQTQKYSLALAYCMKIYNEEAVKGQELLTILLSKYLERTETRSEALELLSTQGSKLDIIEVLGILPPNIPVSELNTILVTSLKQTEANTNQSQLTANLMSLRKFKLTQQRVELDGAHVVVDEDATCKICKKRLGYSVLSWFPNNTVVHYGCSKWVDQI